MFDSTQVKEMAEKIVRLCETGHKSVAMVELNRLGQDDAGRVTGKIRNLGYTLLAAELERIRFSGA